MDVASSAVSKRQRYFHFCFFLLRFYYFLGRTPIPVRKKGSIDHLVYVANFILWTVEAHLSQLSCFKSFVLLLLGPILFTF